MELALGITRGLLKGLAYAHDHKGLDGEPLNIVHRDISPQNVLVTLLLLSGLRAIALHPWLFRLLSALVLPVVGLWWLWRTRAPADPGESAGGGGGTA